jgi:hypothetical protein
VASEDLLLEQQRVHSAVRPFAVSPWPYFEKDQWIPHITIGTGLAAHQIATSIPVIPANLPIHGWLDRGGLEDGSTGENWPSKVTRVDASD